MRVKFRLGKKEYELKLAAKHQTSSGQEIPDPVPMAPPVGFHRQRSVIDEMRDAVRSEHMRLAAIAAGEETFWEADDFEVGDDYDPTTPYEADFEPLSEVQRRAVQEFEQQKRAGYAGDFEAFMNEGPSRPERPPAQEAQEVPARAPAPAPASTPSPAPSEPAKG